MYLQLRSVGLDKSRVFVVREGALDRGALHFTLEDGTIAFTQDVAGRVTGAFFEGQGEVLLAPPDQVERASMALFTHAAILEESFSSAYFRFNDDTYQQLQPSLRPDDHSEEFVLQWNETARNLAQLDALRLLTTFSQFLPSADGKASTPSGDRMLHARVQGRSRGTFDLYYDSDAPEEVWAGQTKELEGATYFNTWASFPMDQARSGERTGSSRADSEDVSVSRYKIRAKINMPAELDADAEVDLDVHRGGQRALLFELSRFLEVRGLQAGGKPVEFVHNPSLEGTDLARLGDDLVAVIFPTPLRNGEHLKLKFSYGGPVLSDAGGGLVYVGARGTWYPNRRPGMSQFDLDFQYPLGWTLIATGKRISEHPADSAAAVSDQQSSRWVTEHPIPIAGFNLGKYSQASAHAGDVLVTTYASAAVEKTFPQPPQLDVSNSGMHSGLGPVPKPMVVAPLPPSPARNAQMVADTSAQAIDYFTRNFGPFAYGSLAITQRPGVVSQGYPGLVFLSSFSFLSEGEKSELNMDPVARTLTRGVIAHETAHEWWGDLVSWSGYRDQWLVEALAEYSSLLFLETKDPALMRTVLDSYRGALLVKNKSGEPLMEAGPVTLGARLSCSEFPTGYEAISYGRGAWLMHMLRSMMRDAELKPSGSRSAQAKAPEPFLRGLRRVRDKYERQPLTTRQFLQVMEEDLPQPLWHDGRKSLDWFYDSWINGTAVPQFELGHVSYAPKGAGVMVSGTITRKDAPEDLITLLPVYAVLPGKSVLIGQVFTEDNETTFRLTAPAGTRKLLLDPYHTVLTRVR